MLKTGVAAGHSVDDASALSVPNWNGGAIRQLTGNMAMPGFTAPKLLCGTPRTEIRSNRQRFAAQGLSTGLPASVSEMSDAAGRYGWTSRSAIGPKKCLLRFMEGLPRSEGSAPSANCAQWAALGTINL
jgi:hypothetical protein